MLNLKILKLNFLSEFNSFEYEKMRALFCCVAAQVQNRAFFDWTNDLIDSELRQSRFLVLALDKEYISFIAYRESADFYEIMALGSHNEHHQKGYAYELLKVLKEQACEASKKIILEVHEQNMSAIKLYESAQFKCIGRRSRYYKDLADALIYEWSKVELK